LVAVSNEVIGHILFSVVSIETDKGAVAMTDGETNGDVGWVQRVH
jgi:predicted N-acetyltransferase YhbS